MRECRESKVLCESTKSREYRESRVQRVQSTESPEYREYRVQCERDRREYREPTVQDQECNGEYSATDERVERAQHMMRALCIR